MMKFRLNNNLTLNSALPLLVEAVVSVDFPTLYKLTVWSPVVSITASLEGGVHSITLLQEWIAPLNPFPTGFCSLPLLLNLEAA